MKKKILLIENNAMFRWRLLHFFEERNYQAFEVEDSLQGEVLALAHKPNLVLSAIDLPRFSGYDLLKRFQSNNLIASIPFIFLTNRDESERDLALKSGASDCLSKALPFDAILERLLPYL